MAGLLKFLFFLIIGWYLFKYLMRLLAPFFLKKFTEKMMRKAQENTGGFSGRGFYYNLETLLITTLSSVTPLKMGRMFKSTIYLRKMRNLKSVRFPRRLESL